MPPSVEKPPFSAYKGKDPYVFISYAHKDAALVFPQLVLLASWGIHVWYDEGIDPGNEWPEEVALALKSASYFVYFVSPHSVRSVNCRNEVYYAQNLKKPFLSIYLKETVIDEINPGLALSIGSLQAVMLYQMDEESFKRKVCKALGMLLLDQSPEPLKTLANKTPKRPIPNSRPNRLVLVGLAGFLGLSIVILFYLKLWSPAAFETPITRPADQKKVTDSPPVQVQTHSSGIGVTWKNSLGEDFVQAGTPGVLFCAYDVRVKDFKEFKVAVSEKYIEADFPQTPNDPVVNVSWTDAQAFCKWLTEKELKSGTIHAGQRYRLPKDAEWSRAAELTEDPNQTPDEKNQKIVDLYPWGTAFPPPLDAGNFARAEDESSNSGSELPKTDGFAKTSPVASFQPNTYGLYDMAGNVWQWCDDLIAPGQEGRVMRGSSWSDHHAASLLSSARQIQLPDGRCGYFGFRCVFESGGS